MHWSHFRKFYQKYHQSFFEFFFSDKESTKVQCEPCSIDDEHVEATHFCKTCDDPEPLCGTCSKHHLKQKLSKNHEMCADIEQFPNEKKNERYFLVLYRKKSLLCSEFVFCFMDFWDDWGFVIVIFSLEQNILSDVWVFRIILLQNLFFCLFLTLVVRLSVCKHFAFFTSSL